jgi:hypothetical protein
MAKVTSPLLSFSARGKLADSLVFFPWKGINAVRQYVIPADTPSAAKDTQRGYITTAVAEYHAAGYTPTDMVAWETLAGIGSAIMSGFNRMIKEHVLQEKLGNVWTRLYQGSMTEPTTTTIDAHVNKAAGGLSPEVYYGLSKTSMLSHKTCGWTAGTDWSVTVDGLTADKMYYFTFQVGVSGATWGRLGIYSKRTAAA